MDWRGFREAVVAVIGCGCLLPRDILLFGVGQSGGCVFRPFSTEGKSDLVFSGAAGLDEATGLCCAGVWDFDIDMY